MSWTEKIRWKANPLLLGILLGGLLMAMTMGSNAFAQERWSATADGETLLHSFIQAPFPHASRAGGYTYGGVFFDAATHYSDSTVGIFIPAGYRPSESVSYVVHFHGWSNHVSQVLDHYLLRQQMAASRRQAILLVPQGPRDATDSSGGRLEMEAGAFQKLIEEVTAFLLQSGKVRTTKIGQIVLSTHSGGYRVTAAILSQGGLKDHITDVLLFDSSYGGLEAFADWAREKNHRLLSIFTRHLAPENYILLTLLKKRKVSADTWLEPDLTPKALAARHTLLIHTLDLEHDEIMQKKSYFSLFLQTSALPEIAWSHSSLQ